MVTVIGYALQFYFLSQTLKSIPTGVAYAIRSGVGVVLISAAAWAFQGHKLDAPAFVGMGLIIAGVVAMTSFQRLHRADSQALEVQIGAETRCRALGRQYAGTGMDWRTRVEPYTRPIFFAVSRWTRGMTLGVRGVAVDAGGRVLLVRHTYLAGWWLPGGGVDRGETTQDAVLREMREETGLIASGPARLISVHSNERFFSGDHVLVFAVQGEIREERSSLGEIAEIGWFAPDALPDDAHRSTRARLSEIFGGAPADPTW